MTTPAFPQLPNPTTLLTGPATALANIERSFPIGAPPVSIGQALSQIAARIPFPAGVGGGLPPLPLGQGSNILASLAPTVPLPTRSNGGQASILIPAGRTGVG